LDRDAVQNMATLLRQGIVQRTPDIKFSDAVECDKVYVTTGHKGNPKADLKQGAKDEKSDQSTLWAASYGAEARLKKKSHPFST
jgi:hypothetical protein